MRDFFVFTMIKKTRLWRHIYHNIGIPRPKNHDIEIPSPKKHDIEIRGLKHHDIEKWRQISHEIVITRRFSRGQKATTSRFQDKKTTTWRFQDQKATTSRVQDQKATTSSSYEILTFMPLDIFGIFDEQGLEGCGKTQNAGTRNTEQQIWNGKTRSSKSGMVKRGTMNSRW